MTSIDMDARVRVARYYDELAVKEWLRLDSDARARVILALHNRILRRFVSPGDLVLDAGCGPGRFAAELLSLCARVVFGDISAVQVGLARQKVASVADGHRVDAALMTADSLPFRAGSFDAVVCFGSVLSHLGDRAEAGLAELAHVAKPGGFLLASVQPALNHYLPYILNLVRELGLEAVDAMMTTGPEFPDSSAIPWRTFSHDEFESLARDIGCEVIEISASNVMATIENIPLLEEMEKDQTLWSAFLRWEERLAKQRGNTERGSHLIAVLRKY